MAVVLGIAARLQKIPESLHTSKCCYHNFLMELTGDWRVSYKDLTFARSWILWRRNRPVELLQAGRVMSVPVPERWSVCIYSCKFPLCKCASSHLYRLEEDWSCTAQLVRRKCVAVPKFQISVKKTFFYLLKLILCCNPGRNSFASHCFFLGLHFDAEDWK